MTLRVLAQQLKMLQLVLESRDSETRDVGAVLVEKVVMHNVVANLTFIVRTSYKKSAWDPRVLSYSVECLYQLLKLMEWGHEKGKPEKQF